MKIAILIVLVLTFDLPLFLRQLSTLRTQPERLRFLCQMDTPPVESLDLTQIIVTAHRTLASFDLAAVAPEIARFICP